jgi:hypothetical protein
MNNVLFEYYIGDTYTRDLTIEDYSADISDMYFSVKQNNKDKHTVLQKTLDNGITLVDIQYDENDNIISRTYNLLIDPDDTESLKPDFDYSFDFEIVSPGANNSEIKKTIITGTFRVLNTTTRKYNEV